MGADTVTAGTDEKVCVEHLFKIFGADPQDTIRRIREGASKDQIYADTASVAAVADVSFSVAQGEIFVVMGLSGSGKSTLIRCINRLIEPTQGRILLDGNDIVGMDVEGLRRLRLNKLSMVFQHFALFPHKTVGENVEYGLKIRGMSARERREKAVRALEQVGLAAYADVPPDNLSGGMQQRVGLARGLAVDPEIMLMDEPFSALDPLIRRDMQDELLVLQQQLRMTIIFITHDLHEALRIGDRIAIMKDGRFVQLGTPEEIVANPADDYVSAFTRDVDRSRVFRAYMLRGDPHALSSDTTIETALERFASLGRETLFMVDEDGRPLGVVRRHDLERGGEKTALRDSLIDDFPSAQGSQELIELYTACATGLPIALVDEAGRLEGIVDPLEVFRLLGGGSEESAEQASASAASGDTERSAIQTGPLEMRRSDHG
ncbi:glycine betaine transport ATP-binding protein OpuAA [Litchfieldella qijiaojingensis]|uniref:Quaternary amine transport ATP-binding protein n=1 Tax=Litchfieldella qijiaojingensis TaxID=980347 RepID=A0ABQ2YP71_9GAMM|nr:glycine betaine/L-proline ABC transporter ATP-binding protein [Halomonas qijiaojingensis]GGX87894.1 glycine betaine transport ATP-binding protein OpuAA [Halomonas qijiaojingensis]